MVEAVYTIWIDSDEDGTFDGDEKVTSDVLARNHIVTTRGKDQIRELAPPRAGSCQFELDNTAGTYDVGTSFNEGQGVRLRATFAAVDYELFTGLVDDLRQNPNHDERSVTVGAIGPMSKLANRRGISTVLYANITTGTALGHLLDAAGWAGADRDIDAGQQTFAWWWLDDNETLFGAMNSLLATEGPGAAIYEDGTGKLVFRDRHARVTESRSIAIQTTFRGTGTEPLHSEPIRYVSGTKDIINVATMTRKARSAAALGEIWALGETLVLAPSEARKFTVRQSDRTPFTAAVNPVEDTDFTVTTGTVSSSTLDRSSGSSAVLTMTAGSGGATVTGLVVRGQSVSVDSTTDIENSFDASASITKHDKRPLPTRVKIRSEISLIDALALMDSYVAYFKDPRPTAEFTVIANRHADAMVAWLKREVGDRVRLISTHSSIDFEAYVEQIRHDIHGAPLHVTTFGVEDATILGDPWIWDTSTWDGDDVFWF